jgi:lysophospholipid acyltransferase (LPLAT)-like uncharacterized protein
MDGRGERTAHELIYYLLWGLAHLHSLGTRVEYLGPLKELLDADKPVLLTWWHQDMVFNFMSLRGYFRRRGFVTMTSRTRDGGLAALLSERMGIKTVRGSGSAGGASALRQLISVIQRENRSGILVCDGPKPHARRVNIGIVAAARDTGLPIVMVRSRGRRQLVFRKTWFQPTLVAPFTKVVLLSDGPVYVPRNAGRPELEKYRLMVQDRLNRLTVESESAFV